MNLPAFDRDNVVLETSELTRHVQSLLDDTHRELAWIRASLVAALYLVLSVVNYFTLDSGIAITATLFSLVVVVSFTGFAVFHRLVDYPVHQVNLISFVELCVLHADSIAFNLVTDGLMSGFGVYVMIVAAGIFMTTWFWTGLSVLMLAGSWFVAQWISGAPIDATREVMMLVSSILLAGFFLVMRIRSSRRLGEHQLMEQKYKETLEEALEHIDTLSGLLPICANCKAIRDEDNAWSSIEDYMAQRSTVAFTHSLCPGCRQELYPEYPKE